MLNNYVTYIFVALGVITVGLNAAGIIDDHIRDSLLYIFGFGGVAGLRRALANNKADILSNVIASASAIEDTKQAVLDTKSAVTARSK